MTNTPLGALLEALLLMAEEPLSEGHLADATGESVEAVEGELRALAQFYRQTERGFELRHVGQGWRYYTCEEHAEAISSWLLDGQQSKLSQAALETLSVIAYLQPISRGRVSAVRGVSVDGVMRTLQGRGLICETGSEESSGATLFATTPLFLEKLGFTSLDELPELAPHLPEAAALEEELALAAAERLASQRATQSQERLPEPEKEEEHD